MWEHFENMFGISIHALREEGDAEACTTEYLRELFQSTPSARRATGGGLKNAFTVFISIHALREEGDAALLLLTTAAHYFNPRPPRGGRRVADPRQ